MADCIFHVAEVDKLLFQRQHFKLEVAVSSLKVFVDVTQVEIGSDSVCRIVDLCAKRVGGGQIDRLLIGVAVEKQYATYDGISREKNPRSGLK